MSNYILMVNGWIVKTGRYFNVTNPSTLEVVGAAAKGTKADAKKALEAAQSAFPKWSVTHGEARSSFY